MLDIVQEYKKLREMYKEDPTQKTFNMLLTGEMGTGKTYLLRTARKPVHIDSFDPGGTKCLRAYIDKGDIVADTQYESEDVTKPKMFKRWYKTFNERVEARYFEMFGTYCMDCSDSWADAIIGAYLLKTGDACDVPNYQKHYHFQKFDIKSYIRKMMQLPCDFILTGHLELVEDRESGKVRYRYMTTGKGSVIIPTLFDEVYVSITKESSSGVTYSLLTQNTGAYAARTRLGAGGVFEAYEEPDIKKLLKKARMPTENKPKLV